MELKTRLKAARRHAKITQEQLADQIGIKQASISELETGKSGSTSFIAEIARACGVNPIWLATGEGEMLEGRSLIYEMPALKPNKAARETNGDYHPGITPVTTWDDDTPLDDDEVEVPFLKEVELSAGGGRTVIQESSRFKLRFGKYTLRRHNVQVEHAVCVPIYGNSMEPVLRSGATVGVDRSKTSVIDGDLYAINHAGQLRVKQLYRLPGGGIRMRSFNRDEHPDEEYTPEQMEAREISLIGRVFWGAMFF